MTYPYRIVLLAADVGALLAVSYVTLLVGLQGYCYLVEPNLMVVAVEIVTVFVLLGLNLAWMVWEMRRLAAKIE